jgi:NitT/TauT family transport system substrate-binding protein
MPSNSSDRLLQVRSVLAAAMVLLLMSACGPKATPQAPQKVKVGIVPFISFSPFFIAKEEGYFTEQNLDVEFQTFDNSTLIMPLLEQGQLDVAGDVPVAGLFNAINQTGNIKIVADRGYLPSTGCDYFTIMASSDWAGKNPAPTADSIRGLRFAADINSIQGYVLDKFLGTIGLTLADVNIQYIPPPNMIEAAKNGSVDLMVAVEPWVTRLADTKKMVVLTGFQKVVPNAQAGFLNYGRLFSKDRPDLGNRFMIAYLKGLRQFTQGKTERNLAIIAQYTKLATDLLQRMCWPDMHSDGNVDLTTVMDFQTWAVARGQLNTVAPETAIWDPQFVNAANKTLGTSTP